MKFKELFQNFIEDLPEMFAGAVAVAGFILLCSGLVCGALVLFVGIVFALLAANLCK